jgi:TonB-dependent receptor
MLSACALALVSAPAHAFAQSAQPVASQAETGAITGVVTDASGSSFLVGAEVRIESVGLVAVTNSEGRFELRRVPAGNQTISVSYIGELTERTGVRVGAGDVAEVSIALGAGGGATLDDVIVTGSRPIAESEAAALQIQRSSTSLVSVVAADAIGRFPDQNVAAAISRLPGIAVQRDQGQERFVNLRGSPSRWTTIAFDGVNVISPAGRTARFDTIPAAIASQIQARKAVTPDMPGETVAGNINIITRGAFDYPGFKAAGDIAIGYNALGGGEQYNVGGYIADRFLDDRLGVLVSASHYSRNMVTDNFETDWEVASEDREAGREERVWADATQNKLYRLTRTNSSLTGRLDFRPSDDHQFFFSSIFTEFTDDELRNANEFDFDTNAIRTDDTRSQMVAPRSGYADLRTGNTPTRGVVFAAELDNTQNINASTENIFTNTLGGDHRAGDWGLEWRLNYTKTNDRSEPPFLSTWRSRTDLGGTIANQLGRPTVEYDFTNPEDHVVRLFDTIRLADGSFARGERKLSLDPQDYEFVRIRRREGNDETDAYSARFDASRSVEAFGMPVDFQMGAQFDQRTKEGQDRAIDVTPASLTAAGFARPTHDDIAINRPFLGQIPLGYNFRYFSESRAIALMDGYLAGGAGVAPAGFSEQAYYRVTEEVLAAYAMATTYFDWGNIVAGARVEQVTNTGEAFAEDEDAGTFTLVETESDNLQVFPSAHINWDLNDEMKLRLSFNTGAARPDYDELAPNFSINDEDSEISGGNPDAGPEKAIGVDAYFEWYMQPNGYFAIGAYYKDLKDVLFDVEQPRFGRDLLNTPAFNRSDYTFFTIDNGGSGYIRGIEVAFSQQLGDRAMEMGLPDWVGGFGIQTNLTLNDSKATTPDGREVDLPGASDTIFNASLYYEKYGFSSRISWQARSEWLDSIGDGDAVGDQYWSQVERLDFSARYELNPNLEWYFDANNLLDEPGVRWTGNADRTVEYERFGARYQTGFRFNF